MATITPQPAQPEMVKTNDARPFWRTHLFKLILLPIGAALAIWFLIIMPRTSKTVDEAFPTTAPAKNAAAIPQPIATAFPIPTGQPAAQLAPAPVTAVQFPPAQPSAAAPIAVKRGMFVAAMESGSGTATIFKQVDGTYILRLEDFMVTNGPDLRVRLLGMNGESLDLGGLKGNKGNQNYELPAGFDPTHYTAADVWCRAFKEQFSTAPLA